MISSTSNPRIKMIKKLIGSSKYRREMGLFVVEGYRGVCEIPKEHIDCLFYVKTKDFELSDFEGVELEELSENVMKSVSATKNSQGLLAICKMPEQEEFDPSKDDVVLVLDRINDPGNLGTIIRSARAADVAYIVLLRGSVDLYNDKVIRSSMGAIFRQKIISGVDFDFVLERIKTKVYAAVLENAEPYYSCKLGAGACFVLGNEANGISGEVLAKIENRITIPMANDSESLNLGVSASILIFEAKRQRGL